MKPTYKAKCHDCGETYQTPGINHIDQWCQTHQDQHYPHTDSLIEVWQT